MKIRPRIPYRASAALMVALLTTSLLAQNEEPEAESAPTERPAFLGVAPADVPAVLAAQLKRADTRGAVVASVVPESPAEKAGIQANDILLKVDGIEIYTADELAEVVAGHKPGTEVAIEFLRGGEEMTLQVTLGEGQEPLAGAEAKEEAALDPGTPPAIRPRRGFRDFFQDDPFSSMEDMIAQMEEMQKKMEQRMEQNFGDPAQVPGSPRALFNQHSTWAASISDDSGSVEVKKSDGKTHVTARDKKGKVIFDGPADTEEERRKMPKEVRQKLDRLEGQRMGPNSFRFQFR